MHVCVFSAVRLFVAPWTVARQAPLSRGFSRQEHWGGLPFPPPGDRPDTEMEAVSPALAAWFFYLCATWEAQFSTSCVLVNFK